VKHDLPRDECPAPAAAISRYAVYTAVLLGSALYAVFFTWLSLQRYDAFLMHALDMGNLDQAAWHTLHGQLFYFTNMRVPLAIEAWGTTTRLSFHVEPILVPIALLYVLHAGPQTLIAVQAVVVALGAPAATRLAFRLTGSASLALAAALAYLLAPSLQAATLYEFHPVTLSAALLLWAIVFAEERRLWQFTLMAVLAIGSKEEIGLLVAALCLWQWFRGRDRRFWVVAGALAAGWSLIAVEVIVPHFARGPSAYWQRYINAGAATGRTSSGLLGVLHFWLQHPVEPFLTLLWVPKLAMLHRWLVATGYLGLLGWPVLLAGAPSLAILLLSTDQHMYGGLAHYSAELVPIGVAAAIYGVQRLVRLAGPRVPPRAATLACALWLAGMALTNEHFNGFTPLAANYQAPVITAHDRLGARLLQRIPPNAPVSAMDQLDPHLGDRPATYLFPDLGDASYVALDVTSSASPATPLRVEQRARALLASRHWRIVAAQDGYLILHHSAALLAAVPSLPAAFYSFAFPTGPAGPPLARFGPALALVGVHIERREQVNLRVPDAIVIAEFRVLAPLPPSLWIDFQVTHTGRPRLDHYRDQAIGDWLSPAAWPVGALVSV
jgi:uncharacterized membrane protein